MGAADASRRFAYCNLVVGTLPSRRLAVMSLYWQHLATPDVVDELFVTCLPTSSVLTSADVVEITAYSGCTNMSLREATVFVAPWQSPERVPFVYDYLR